MLRIISLFLLILFCSVQLTAQKKPTLPYIGPDAPDWMLLLAQDTPDAGAVQRAYKTYYKSYPYQKNDYTQYYKRWMHWVRTFARTDGSLRFPEPETLEKTERQLRQLRQGIQDRGGSLPWTFVGPKRTYDTDGSPEVTWQTNIYSFDIAPTNAGILYAGGESGGIWKTTDKGLNWTLLTTNVLHDGFTAVKIHPLSSDTVYAATNGKIIKTVNGGSTWTTVYAESGLEVHEIAFKSNDPKIVLAAGNKGLLRTANSGTSWSKLFTNETWAVKFKVGDPSRAYAIRDNGSSSNFMISTNGGTSFSTGGTGWWTPATGESVTGAHLAVCPSNASKLYAYLCGEGANLYGYIGVFVSADNGATWTNTNPAGSVGNSPVAYVMPGHTNLMANDGVRGFNQGFYDMAIIVNPANENQLIAGGTSWFKSTDGGATWTGLGGYIGSLSWSHPDIQALRVSGSDLWIASDGGLNYSTDFGGSMVARMNGISGADLWGFDSGWNEDVLVGGRYHNGNMAWHQSFPAGQFYRMGGAESPTGYVNAGDNRKTYFSDIGGYRILPGFGNNVTGFSVGLFPNESYAYYANSEMTWDPRCWNTVYLGNENKIWKSTDGGASFQVLYAFPGAADKEVFEIEVCRANPDVIYCSQWDGTDDAMWKTTNGGVSWNQLTPLPLPNNNDRVKMAVSATDPNILWVAVTYGDNGKKVYKSTNGGSTWTNLTTALLNNIRVTDIMAQHGTNGGVYLGCDGAVFYRNNTHSDWQPYSTGLPLSAETNRLKPFYRDGKLRNGCWGFGVWEAALFEPSAVIAQPITSDLAPRCVRDTVYFDDYSVVNHSGTSWSWSFSPAPAYVSATSVRNPKVVFGNTGTYTATMTLNGTHTKSLTIQVGNECLADTIPGSLVSLGGNLDEGHVSLPALNLTTNTLTVTAWVKIEGTQPEYSGIWIHDGTNVAGFNFRPNNNKLGYHWPNGSWGWDGGPVVPTDEWTHVAMVMTPTGVTLYVNGVGATHNFTAPAVHFNGTCRLGNYRGWGGRYMKGKMDEVCVFNTALTQAQIREMMHLTKDPATLPNLISYYQFNEAAGPVLDRAGVRHAALGGSAVRGVSGGPFAKGTAARVQVTATGTVTFPGTGIQLGFPSVHPNGEVVVTRLNRAPNEVPNPARQLTSGGYWIVRNYGTNNLPTSMVVTPGRGVYAPDPPASFTLMRRNAGSDLATWATADPEGDAIAGRSLTFNTNLSFQFGQQYAIADTKGVRLAPKVFLQGSYDPATDLMADGLRSLAVLPAAEPYTALGFAHQNGGGGEAVNPALWNTTGNNAIVDWMMVELRSKNAPATVLYTRAALVQRDGDVVEVDGTSPLYFSQAPPDQYYIALRHRNHLGFRTATAQALTATATAFNFANNSVSLYGTAPLRLLEPGTYGMYSGDANRDGSVNLTDRTAHWRLQNGAAFHYLNATADFNLDGTVNAVDRNLHWRVNDGVIGWLD